MIVDVARVKKLLNITGADYDDMICAYIPLVTEQVVREVGQEFLIKNQYDYSQNTIFKATNKTLQMVGHDFANNDWKVGFDIRVRGSNFNLAFYKIKSISSDTITFESDDGVVEEDSGDKTVYIIQSIWPKLLEATIANMVNLNVIASGNNNPVQSESIGSYSVTYAIGAPSSGQVVYPQNIQQGINAYRIPKFVPSGKSSKYPWERHDH